MREFVDWDRIIIHHSATADGDALDFLGIRHFHRLPEPNGRGWRDIGYHFVVERIAGEAGSIVGRSLLLPGAHCPLFNRRAIGICVVGNYELSAVPDDLFRELVRLCSALCGMLGIKPERITGHRDHKETLCPGAALYSLLPTLRSRVDQEVRG